MNHPRWLGLSLRRENNFKRIKVFPLLFQLIACFTCFLGRFHRVSNLANGRASARPWVFWPLLLNGAYGVVSSCSTARFRAWWCAVCLGLAPTVAWPLACACFGYAWDATSTGEIFGGGDQ